MKFYWSVYKRTKTGHFILWDGPSIPTKAEAESVKRQREKDYPEDTFIVVREER